jgi:hypothetical protein
MHFLKMRFSLVVIILLYATSNACSQIEKTTNSLPGDSILAGFNQTLSTLNWTGNVEKDWAVDNFSASINENFQSVMIKSSPNLIRDVQNFSGQVNRRVTGNFWGFGAFQSTYVSDNRQIGLNSVGTSQLQGGLFFSDGQDSILGGAGNKWDRQAGVSNSGFTYSLNGTGTFNPLLGSEFIPFFAIHDEQILPRRNFDRSFGLTYGQIFSPQAFLRFNGSYVSQLRDFFFPADSSVQTLYDVTNNIQDRNEDKTSFATTIQMPVWLFELNGQASYAQRQIDFTYRYKPAVVTNTLYDTRIRTSNFNISGNLITKFGNDTLIVTMEHNERSETHTVINAILTNPFTEQQSADQSQLNNLGTRNMLTGQLFLHFGPNSLLVTGLASLFRYDTPSPLNYDDRDELTNTISIQFNHEFSPSFNAGFGIETDLIHMVYIESQRSANNNRNFIYRFFPTVNYSDRNLTSSNRFEVLANYTVYDYEAFSQIHSFSFRQASFLDSTKVNVTQRLSLFFLGNVKLYTRGELYWSSFSEFPLNYFVDRTFWLSLSYFAGNLGYAVGYKYLSLTQYNYTTTKDMQFASQITNSGPTAIISVNLPRLEVRMTGWYQISRQLLQYQVVYPNFEITAKYRI